VVKQLLVTDPTIL